MSVSSLAASPVPTAPALQTPAANSPTAANDTAPAGAQVTAEAELTLTVTQETRITISVSSGSDGSGAKDGSKTPTDPNTAHALSTLESVADAQRAWIKALEAKRDGRHDHKADATADPSTASATGADKTAGDNAAAGPTVQISIAQETTVEAQLTVGAQIDVQA